MEHLDPSKLRIDPFEVDRDLFTQSIDDITSVLGERPLVSDVLTLVCSFDPRIESFHKLELRVAMELARRDLEAARSAKDES